MTGKKPRKTPRPEDYVFKETSKERKARLEAQAELIDEVDKKASVELLIESLESIIDVAKAQVEINELFIKHFEAQDEVLEAIYAAVDRLEMKP